MNNTEFDNSVAFSLDMFGFLKMGAELLGMLEGKCGGTPLVFFPRVRMKLTGFLAFLDSGGFI
jgi:hypothetical protein